MDILTVSLLILIIGVCTFILGKATEVIFRAKVMRSITKKDYGVFGLVSKDQKNIRLFLVNLDKFTITHNNKIWTCQKKKIYRIDSPEKQFTADKGTTRFVEGVPLVFVDDTSLIPLDFYTDAGAVSPYETGATFTAWINNQIAKNMAAFKQQQMLFYVAIMAAAIAAYFGFQAMDVATKANANSQAVVDKLNILYPYDPETQTYQNMPQTTPSSNNIVVVG